MSSLLLETIRCEDGEPVNLSYHQGRVNASLKQLGYTTEYNLKKLLSPPDNKLYRCRILYNDNSIDIQYLPYQKRVISRLQLIQADGLEYALKYANREEIDKFFLQKGDADDILLVKNTLITDTSIANIALYDGEKWYTPKSPLLHGTTRARLLKEKKIFERDIYLKDLPSYSRFALMNAMIDFDTVKNGIISPIKGEIDVV